MKFIIAVVCVFCSVQAFAVQLNLSSGESAVIRANAETYVTCEGSPSGHRCQQESEGFKQTLSACYKSYSGGYCAENYWPKFKSANPNCISSGIAACIEYCEKSYSGGYCADVCQ